jgi:ADP-ribose pyrophosphatase YjhB (NUDIX family)
MDRERIRPIVICLFSRGERILVNEAYDSSKRDYFCRPLGGGIEFGEHSRDAVLREIREETGAEVENLKLVGVLENIFTYEGEPGHEIVFVYDAEFVDKSLYEGEGLHCYESEIDVSFVARWQSPDEIRRVNVRLVPEPLAELLKNIRPGDGLG